MSGCPSNLRPATVAALAFLSACARAEAPAGTRDSAPGAPDSPPGVQDSRPGARGSVPDARSCSADARPGVVVAVEDARSGQPLSGYTLWLRGDAPEASARVDSAVVTAPPPARWGGALERPGRYALRVAKAGYQPWDSAGVVVTSDACHVRTVHLRVRLQPR